MRCLIRKRSAEGAWTESPLETPRLTLGRGTHNDIELPGLLVAQEHAQIGLSAEGRYRLEALTLAGVEVNDQAGVSITVLKPGDRLRIGDNQLQVEPAVSPYHLVIAVQTVEGGASSLARRQAPLDLHAAGLGMRRPALLLAVLVLVMGLGVPLAWRAMGVQGAQEVPLVSDAFWSSGRISNAHAHFAGDCQRCHQKLFTPVGNDACAACHAGVPHHSDHPAVTELGASATECTACHQEHEGKHGLAATAPPQCTGCHERPERFPSFPAMAAAGDFADDHPEFSRRADDPQIARLIFSHSAHLPAEGVRGPQGVEQLNCASCHRADEAHVGFSTPNFENQCQRCHALKAVINGREVELPHGENEALRRMLQQAGAAGSAAPAPTGLYEKIELRRRAGRSADRGAGAAADPGAQVTDIVEFRVCARCHQTERDAENLPRVRPPAANASGFPAAHFSHASHKAVDCAQCHDSTAASGVTAAAETLLPPIAVCRSCHTGADSSHGVSSTCADCHRFHRAQENTLIGSAP